jgi:uncharacterized protein (DUF433 family)
MARARTNAARNKDVDIVRNPKVRGGAPVVGPTGVRVMDVAVRYEVLGMSPEEIASALPHLTLAQIHAALSYYYAHKAELDREWKAALRRTGTLRKRSTSLLERKLGPLADLPG